MASFFRPHHYYNVPEPNFQGLFRLIDDFDRYSNQASPAGSNSQARQGSRGNNVSFFTPKFDMTESEAAYELHGELPGLAKEDVHIEFTDPQTLQIRGKVERTRTAGTPPAGLLEEHKEQDTSAGAITEGNDDHAETSSVKSHSSHHATVEDDPEENGGTAVASSTSTTQSTPQDTPATTVVEAAKPEHHQSKPVAAPKHKYYLVERNIGSFARSFNFPTRVDNESVQASLKDGILTIVVQKAKKHESRRIAIN